MAKRGLGPLGLPEAALAPILGCPDQAAARAVQRRRRPTTHLLSHSGSGEGREPSSSPPPAERRKRQLNQEEKRCKQGEERGCPAKVTRRRREEGNVAQVRAGGGIFCPHASRKETRVGEAALGTPCNAPLARGAPGAFQVKEVSTFLLPPELFPLVPGVHGAVASGGFELQVPQAHGRGRSTLTRLGDGTDGVARVALAAVSAAVCTSASFPLPSPSSARQLGHASF